MKQYPYLQWLGCSSGWPVVGVLELDQLQAELRNIT
jgi:hypothetical protein